MRRLLLLLPLLLLAACGRQPDAAQVQKDVEERLNSAFPSEVLTLDSFERQGRMKTADGLVVFFKAGLRVDDAVDFGQWGAPNAQLLAGVLGAGSKGIAGLTQGGNKTGDKLTVFGTLGYSDADGRWVPAAAPGPVETRVGGPPGTLTGAERLLAILGDTLRAAPAHTSPTGSRVIEEELEGAKRHIDARLARLAAGYPVASGPPGGAYERLAKTLSADAAAQGVTLAVLQTAGSVENIGLLRSGTAELAFAQADVAALASAGKGVFASAGPYDTLRALLALFPEQVHIVVRADDKAQKIVDLNGRRAALGLAKSGTRVTASYILDAAGVEVVEPQGTDALDPRGALAALANGDVDVAFVVGLAPFTPVVEAFASARLRLLPIAESFADAIRSAGLIPLQIPAYAYSGQREAVPAAAVAALLVVDARLTDAEAKKIGEAVLGRIGASERDPLSLMVGPGTAGLGIAVPLHPGAGRFGDIRLR